MFRQSKQESNNTDLLAITINTSQHNKIHNVHKKAAFSRQKSRLRSSSLKAESLLSRAGRCNASVGEVIFGLRKGDEIPPYLVWVLPLISIRASVQYRQEYNTKR